MKLPVEVHPVANLFPMMTDDEFAKLKADILANGQTEPVTFWREQLIDGRNRYRACMELGVQCSEQMLDDDSDPIAYVMSENLHRRHLTETQRSMVAAKLATLRNGQKKSDQAVPIGTATLDEAANLLNVGRRNVARAKKVIEHAAPALVEAVERGDVAVSLAAKLVDECDDKREQARLAKAGSEAIREFMTPPAEVKRKPCPDEKALTAFRKAENRLNVLRHIVAELEQSERNVLIEWLTESEV